MLNKPEPTLASIRNLLKEVPEGAEVSFRLADDDKVEVKLKIKRRIVAKTFQPTRLVHPTKKLLDGMMSMLHKAAYNHA